MSWPAHPVLAVAGIAFRPGRQVLLIQRGAPPARGLWTVPGGKVELGETLAAACARELYEETGLLVEPGPVVEVVERIPAAPGAHPHYVIVDLLVEVRGGTLRAASDAAAAAWQPLDRLAGLPLTEGLEPVLARAWALRERHQQP
jgi:ADP-ribose pyrophosphatase YjhB (NUDIX family)